MRAKFRLGRPCRNCNRRLKYKSTYNCVRCQRAHYFKSKALNPKGYAAAQRESTAKWKTRNPEKARNATTRWRAKSGAHIRAYEAANAAARGASSSRRRAKKAGNGGAHTAEEWLALVALRESRCCYCLEICKPTREHKVPISKGGTDDLENIDVACKFCNCSRGNRYTYEDFKKIVFQRKQIIDGLQQID